MHESEIASTGTAASVSGSIAIVQVGCGVRVGVGCGRGETRRIQAIGKEKGLGGRETGAGGEGWMTG